MARYRNLPMPNLSLSDDEAKALIHYMEQQDKLHDEHGHAPPPKPR
jgi:hypothetical protein